LLIQGIEVDLPKTDTTKMSISSEPLVISIDSTGKYFLNLGEEELPISLMELKNKAKIIYQANPDIEIVFKSDANVPFNFVAKGMASIQSLGIQKVGIITTGYDS
jgi:biopolymer transport protein TolR